MYWNQKRRKILVVSILRLRWLFRSNSSSLASAINIKRPWERDWIITKRIIEERWRRFEFLAHLASRLIEPHNTKIQNKIWIFICRYLSLNITGAISQEGLAGGNFLGINCLRSMRMIPNQTKVPGLLRHDIFHSIQKINKITFYDNFFWFRSMKYGFNYRKKPNRNQLMSALLRTTILVVTDRGLLSTLQHDESVVDSFNIRSTGDTAGFVRPVLTKYFYPLFCCSESLYTGQLRRIALGTRLYLCSKFI